MLPPNCLPECSAAALLGMPSTPQLHPPLSCLYRAVNRAVGPCPSPRSDKAEKEAYGKRDPLPKLKEYMLANKLATEAEIKDIERAVMDEVEGSVKFADESPKPSKSQLLENVFADPR